MTSHSTTNDVAFQALLDTTIVGTLAQKKALLLALQGEIVVEHTAINLQKTHLIAHTAKVDKVLGDISVIETFPPIASSGGVPVPKSAYSTTNDSVNGPFTGTNQYRTITATTQGGTISIEFDNTANGSDFVFNTGSGHIMYITMVSNLILANSVVAVTLHSVSATVNDPDLYIHRIIDGEGGRVKLVVRFNKIWTISALSTETFNLNYVIL